MGTVGLFTREDVKKAGTVNRPSAVNVERLWQIGEKGVERMNPQARSIHTPPSGSKHPLVYCLGEANGEQEDLAGEPFVGPSGRLLRSYIPEGAKVRFNNVCRTMPVKRGSKGKETRKPTPHEIECYRMSIWADIEKTQPKIVLGLGGIPFHWATGLNDAITFARGRKFPVKIGSYVCWFYPTIHPAFVLRALDSREMIEQVPGDQWEAAFARDVRVAFEDAETVEPPEIDDEAHLLDGVRSLTKFTDVISALENICKHRLTGLDLETNALRPYGLGAKILSIGIAGKDEAFAFPLDHPDAKWTKAERAAILAAVKTYILKGGAKTVHNLMFDLEWLSFALGLEILDAEWHCSQAQAYVHDHRAGCQSLNSLTQLHFGFRIKTFSEVDRANLANTSLSELLPYNGLDAKYHRRLFLRQRAVLKEEGMWPVYTEHVLRIPAMVQAQINGIPVNQVTVKAHRKDLQEKVEKVLEKIHALDVVKRYCKRFGKFNPNSGPQLGVLLKDVLGRNEGDRGKGKAYGTDEEILNKIDLPVTKLILEMRKIKKIKDTYLDKLDPSYERTVVWPDGKLHPQYRHTLTDTSRISISDPSGQNYPKRKNIEVRRPMAPASDKLIVVSCDLGQIEYRVIGMHTYDKVVVESCWSDYDVHAVWAEKIIKKYDKTYKDRYGKLDPKDAFKKFRGDVKNQFVFPFFFGAGWRSIGNNLEMPEEKIRPLYEEAHEYFKGVSVWQKKKMEEYKRNWFVSSLSGRRRYGPMSKNMVVNAPIQTDAAELNINAMHRLATYARESGKLYLSTDLQIHDDLVSFKIPKNKLDEAIPVIVKTMCKVPFKWAHVVPLSVEVAVGPTWADLEEIGKYRSDKLDQL